ncbi:AAA family ATPase [Salinicola halophyticus]|uniref:AAA family ATPase n=1 Tax=Salinicola halophyticus TaxID=1808881 RepID=UPI000DA1A0F8|nr:AAA family ATPase [Salinicola halophyticus]
MNPSRATTTIALFGHFSYQRNAQSLTQFSYDKVKALLVYLLLQETPVSRAALAEMLWPDQGVKSGRTNLRHALHCLRHSLGDLAEASLSVTRQTITFELPLAVSWDLREAERLLQRPPTVETLEQLLDHYRGDLLAELHLGQCVAFQQWLVRTRGEWRQRLIEYAERVLETSAALPEALLRTLIHRIPDYGPFHERLVRQLAEHGQFAAAREQFNAFLQHLALSGQQPEPGFLQLARFWSEVPARGLGGDWPNPASGSTPTGGQQGVYGYATDDIDYRQITVMAIALRPEEAGNDLGRALACLKAQQQLFAWLETQCRHLGGFWQAAVGSGIGLACFGTHGPTHQLAELVALFEHCRQGLSHELENVWDGGEPPPRFTLTAGLDSGRVIWLPERQSIDPFGDVTQVALAMMAAAQRSELVISLNASQHLPPAFDLQSRLAPRLISSDGRVQRRGLVLTAGGAGRDTLPPNLLGREGELRQLRDALARVSLGLRQSVLVLGDTGIGKSALMIHFREYLQHEDAAVFWRPTTRLSSQTSYGLIQSLLRWHLEQEPSREVLETLIDRTRTLDKIGGERRQLLIDVLGREPLAREDADEAVELVTQLIQAVILEMTASRRPLVIIVDDLQWLDEPSLKVIQNLQARLPIHTASLLVASHQNREVPSVRLNWDQQVVLGRLDTRQSSDMLDYLGRKHRLKLNPRLRQQLIERCEGVPLYLQELCRRLEIDRREGRRLDVASLPSGLLGLLASRIDQLQGSRQVAHMAATFGRQFEAGMLRECLETDDTALKVAIEQMRRLEIIEPCETYPYDFQFTHPLLQEAAYLSCPQDVRIVLHQRVVELIESRYPAWISRHPGDFAEHLRRSRDAARAARYFEMAARGALKVSANRTALKMAESGLDCLGTADGAERQVSLLTVKGQACYALEGHGSPTAHESFLQAQKLWQGSPLDEEEANDQAFLVTWGLWVGASQRHANQEAESLALQLRDLAQRIDDARYHRLALYARAHGEYWSGQVALAYEHLDQIDPLNRPMVLEWLPYSDHPQVAAACYQSWALCLRGDYRRAEQQMEAAIRLAESVRHPGSLAMALIFAASLYRQLGHVHLAIERGRRAHEMTRTADLQRWHWEAECVLGWGQSLAGEAQGFRRIEDSVRQLSELTGREPCQRPFLWYGDACLALNDVARAVAYLEPCLRQARSRRSLMMPQISLQMARAKHRMGDEISEVAALIEEARSWAIDAGSPHMELKSLEMWLSLVDPADTDKRHALRYRLGEVALSDAPVLTRWRTLLDNVSATARQPDYQFSS